MMTKLISDFLDDLLLARGRSPQTVDAYRRNLKQFQGFADEHLWESPRQAFAPHALRLFVGHLQECQYRPATIKQKIATLQAFAAYLHQVHPEKAPKDHDLRLRYRVEKRAMRTLSPEELQSLLEELKRRAADLPALAAPDPRHRAFIAHRDWALFSLLAGTGLRVGEVVALRLQDLDLDRGEIHVRGKGGHQRIVFCDLPEIQEPLQCYLRRRAQLADRLGPTLFVNGRDLKPLSTRAVQLRLKELARALALPDSLTPHTLRHTYATLAVERGINLKALAQLLGHADVQTTLQLYTHLSTHHLHQIFRLCHPLRDNRLELPEIINNRKDIISYRRTG
jgi:site-specific recombinase XerD